MCGFCGGLGRVAAGGITSQFAGVYGMDVRPCGQCHGTGRASPANHHFLPYQRTATAIPDLSAVLPGGWLVEIHGLGRILAVIRFLLSAGDPIQRFDARCEYGGLPEWRARGEWTVCSPGNVLRLSGAQSSPVLLTAGYRWDVTLDELGRGLLRGESISDELTVWTRKLDLTAESELRDDRAAVGADPETDAGREPDPGVHRVDPAFRGSARR